MILVKVASKRRQNYIEERGILPIYEEDHAAYYKKTKQLLQLLEDYQILKSFYNRKI